MRRRNIGDRSMAPPGDGLSQGHAMDQQGPCRRCSTSTTSGLLEQVKEEIGVHELRGDAAEHDDVADEDWLRLIGREPLPIEERAILRAEIDDLRAPAAGAAEVRVEL